MSIRPEDLTAVERMAMGIDGRGRSLPEPGQFVVTNDTTTDPTLPPGTRGIVLRLEPKNGGVAVDFGSRGHWMMLPETLDLFDPAREDHLAEAARLSAEIDVLQRDLVAAESGPPIDVDPGLPQKSERGLYRKYVVRRTDGRDTQGQKHESCRLFILDIDHDEHARAALSAYAESCHEAYPELASDLRKALMDRQHWI